jgi:microcystin-dependent protein
MPANTPRGFPYPLPTEPVAEGAQAIRNLAEAVDVAAVPIGAPIPWLTATIPAGYREFDGSAIVQATHPKLFALFGATIPDLRGRMLMGAGGAPGYAVGALGGTTAETLTAAQSGLPAHSHNTQFQYLAWENTGYLRFLAHHDASYEQWIYYTSTITANAAQNAAQSHNNMPPYRAIRWITAAA